MEKGRFRWILSGTVVVLLNVGIVSAYVMQDKSTPKIETVSDSEAYKTYNAHYSEEEELKKKAEPYESWYIKQLAQVENVDLKQPSDALGIFVDKATFNSAVGSDVLGDANSVGVSYYYDADNEYLTQQIVLTDTQAGVMRAVYVQYNRDLQVLKATTTLTQWKGN